MRFGSNAGPVTILRRAVQDDTGGVPRGDYQIAFVTQADWKPAGGREALTAGLAQDELETTFRVQDGARNRTITAADKIVIGRLANIANVKLFASYDIVSVQQPDRLAGAIAFNAVRRVS